MDFDYQIYKLTNAFTKDYPSSTYPEILTKPDRPHYCLLIDMHCDYFICVPYRSNINHNNAFLFKGTNRSKQSRSGLDYSKIAIIDNIDYLDDKNIVIDHDEYTETINNSTRIVAEASEYVNTYIAHINGTSPLHQKEYDRKYKFSTLKYYHDILGLDEMKNKNKERETQLNRTVSKKQSDSNTEPDATETSAIGTKNDMKATIMATTSNNCMNKDFISKLARLNATITDPSLAPKNTPTPTDDLTNPYN